MLVFFDSRGAMSIVGRRRWRRPKSEDRLERPVPTGIEVDLAKRLARATKRSERMRVWGRI